MTLAGYISRRVLTTLVTLLIVALVVFVLIRLIPADPVALLFGDAVSPEQAALLRQQLGLDRPLPVQFVDWLMRMLSGDLGRSIRYGEPVLTLMLDRFRVSAVIIFTAVAAATLIAVPAGTIAAWRQGSAGDLAIVIGATLLLSVPSFWLGLLLLLTFGVKLGWLPVIGYVPFDEDVRAALAYMVMPVVTLVVVEVGVLARMARSNSIDVLSMEYVTHARAKGLPEPLVLSRHVFPNAFAPTMTLIGLITGQLLGGLAVIETVFTLPGFGRLLVEAIFARDYPVIQGCLLFTALFFVAINLIVDLLYPLFDPRVAVE